MAKKKKKSEGPNINIKGGVKAGGDVVFGDQTNIGDRSITNIRTKGEFNAELEKILAGIAALKQQPELNKTQLRTIEDAEKQVRAAAEEASKEDPNGSKIKETLSEAKDIMDMLKGGLASAVGLGAQIAGVISMGMHVFGV